MCHFAGISQFLLIFFFAVFLIIVCLFGFYCNFCKSKLLSQANVNFFKPLLLFYVFKKFACLRLLREINREEKRLPLIFQTD